MYKNTKKKKLIDQGGIGNCNNFFLDFFLKQSKEKKR